MNQTGMILWLAYRLTDSSLGVFSPVSQGDFGHAPREFGFSLWDIAERRRLWAPNQNPGTFQADFRCWI
jgi:hypothetical protein